MKKCCDKRMIWVSMLLLLFLCFLHIASALEKDPLKDMDLNPLTEETSVEEKAKFLSISGYLESHSYKKDASKPKSVGAAFQPRLGTNQII